MRLRESNNDLDAEFAVVESGGSAPTLEITLEASGGGRNVDYALTLEILLTAIGAAGGSINRIEVASRPAMLLSEQERTLQLKYPVKPGEVNDLDALRSEISRLQVPIAQRPGAKGGNSTKRLKIFADLEGMPARAFVENVVPEDGFLRRRAFLLTWNPDVWDDWKDREAEIAATAAGCLLEGRWSTGSRRKGIRGGDRLFLLRQGRSARGIVGIGAAAGIVGEECVFQEAHYLPERAAAGDEASYVDVTWELLLADDERIPTEDLKEQFPEVHWDNIQSSGQRLPARVAREITKELLDAEAAVGSAPEVKDAAQALGVAAGKVAATQGFRQSAAQRAAIETHAMSRARKHLKALGWTDIVDTSNGNPFDFLCRDKKGSTLHVEVKGTTSGGDAVVLTRREVELHREVYPANALVLVHSITLDGDKASGGRISYTTPWQIEDSALQVIGYTYRTSKAGND